MLRLDRNLGYGRAVNLAAQRAEGEALVLLNDDSWQSAGSPPADRRHRVPDADYLNGEPVSILQGDVPDPVGPTGAAAAFDREAFLSAEGFDERLFAYLEDVDLVLRLRRDGCRCGLATEARGTHRHSATLGPGSARKDYLAGYGRGYLLWKWNVISLPRLPSVLVREVPQAVIQSIVDRNLGSVRGRVNGLRGAARHPSPTRRPRCSAILRRSGPWSGRRWRRRARLRRRDD